MWMIFAVLSAVFAALTSILAMITTTMVRIAVARLDFTPSIPILARIEVIAANTADKTGTI